MKKSELRAIIREEISKARVVREGRRKKYKREIKYTSPWFGKIILQEKIERMYFKFILEWKGKVPSKFAKSSKLYAVGYSDQYGWMVQYEIVESVSEAKDWFKKSKFNPYDWTCPERRAYYDADDLNDMERDDRLTHPEWF